MYKIKQLIAKLTGKNTQPRNKQAYFKINRSMRCGNITYQSGDNKLEIYWEISGNPAYNILLAPIDMSKWSEPKGENIPRAKQKEILKELRAWTKSQRMKTDIDIPDIIELENKKCIWKGCDKKRIKGYVYCSIHYDECLLTRE